MPSAADVVEPAELLAGGEVGVAGAGDVRRRGIILRPDIRVGQRDEEGSSGRFAVIESAPDPRDVGFAAGRRARRSGPAPFEVLGQVGGIEAETGRTAVDHDADFLAVGFPVNRDPENSAECVHDTSPPIE